LHGDTGGPISKAGDIILPKVKRVKGGILYYATLDKPRTRYDIIGNEIIHRKEGGMKINRNKNKVP